MINDIKNLTKYGFSRALRLIVPLLMLSACSDAIEPDQGPGKDDNAEGQYFITLKVSVPNQAGTRADNDDSTGNDYTDNQGGSTGGNIAGTEPESQLLSASLYFVVENQIKLKFESDYIQDIKNVSGKTHEIRIKIDDDIEKFAQFVGKDVFLYLVGNTGSLYSASGMADNADPDDASFSVATAADNVIGDFGSNGHLMPLVNASEFKVSFKGVNSLNDIKNTFFDRDTGTIKWWDVETTMDLERAVARLEFRDLQGRQLENSGATSKDNTLIPDAFTYWIGQSDVKVKIYSLTPFNVNKNSYLFRHTADGTATAANQDAVLFGKERVSSSGGYNWVASKDWAYTSGAFTKSCSFANAMSLEKVGPMPDEYEYTLGATDSNILVSALVERNKKDGVESTDFMPWCYVTENTLPSTDYMQHFVEIPGVEGADPTIEEMITKNATGVMFTVMVLDKAGNPLTYEATTPDSGSLYPSEITNSDLTPGNIIITMSDGKWREVEPTAVTLNGVQKNVYLMNYIACIVHNADPNYTTSLAPMYYGVVRNNTYRITVKEIPNLPLPRDPRSIWLKVDVTVLPWIIRSNNFDF